MKIETSDYQIAPLTGDASIIDVIKQAEAKLADLTGNDITLIAYTKAEEEE